MKRKNSGTIILAGISGLGILCSGCQEKSTDAAVENGGGDTTQQTVTADLSDNLDLTVVVALFGESENLEDFEKKLNDPDRQVSNLDLNEDGEVDYLRVVESTMDETHLVSVQAVLGEDMYQDVATFDVERDQQGQTQVQVVGDPYVYGPDYVVRPTYERPLLITALFWAATYHAWRSPYTWGRYPSYYRPWRPYPPYQYRDRVSHYRHPNYSYGYWSGGKRSKNAVTLYGKSKRNDYASKHAAKSFNKRNKGVANRYELTQKRVKTKGKGAKMPVAAPKPGGKATTLPAGKGKAPTPPSVKPGGKPAVLPSGKGKAPTTPTVKPGGKPAVLPSGKGKAAPKPTVKPSVKPSGKPSGKPSVKPSVKPSGKSGGGKPASKPAGKPAKTEGK